MSKIARVSAALISYILTFRKIVSNKKKTRTLSNIKNFCANFTSEYKTRVFDTDNYIQVRAECLRLPH
jgi:hypothetical protein